MSFSVTGKGFWELNFRIGGRKPPDKTPWFRIPLSGGSEPGIMSEGLRSPILGFQVGDVWFCGFYPALSVATERGILTW